MNLDVDPWFALAEGSLKAARILVEEECWRSAVSRAYYSMYQSATVVFKQAGLKPPPRGNWPHDKVPRLFMDPVVRPLLLKVGRNGTRLKQAIEMGYRGRVDADYDPSAKFDPSAVRDAMRFATEMIELARKLIH